MARFLEKLASKDEWTKGRLQPAVRLNYDLFLRYLEEMEARGLLKRIGDGREERIQITARGHELGRRIRDWIATVFATSF